MESLNLQHWTRIGAMNLGARASVPARLHPLADLAGKMPALVRL